MSGPVVPPSPFFRPSATRNTAPVRVSSPASRAATTTAPSAVDEAKSTILGCSANLANAIVGSGIVGIPYALYSCGLGAGIVLVILCVILTDISLRLLMTTAKHAHTASYERVAEAAYGKWGFRFVAANMFLMAAGAMVSYLMIVKDTLPVTLGIEDAPRQRAVLLLLSLTILLPLSCQRDMANLAKTSRLSVLLDTILIGIVAWQAPVATRMDELGFQKLVVQDVVRPETLFVGLGVLSFAFVCQHSAFLIAGSLDRPTVQRWATVTAVTTTFCGVLAMTSGVFGYLGYGTETRGNVLNNLPISSLPANTARLLLGTTMLFVYPMESFVARHVCVALLFTGQRAHDGNDDSLILNRTDRRIILTVVLWFAAFLAAVLSTSVGSVLAVTGAIGGSSLSYIGPGAVYLGIHGEAFLKQIENSTCFGLWYERSWNKNRVASPGITTTAVETTPLVAMNIAKDTDHIPGLAPSPPTHTAYENSVYIVQIIAAHLTLMPLWCTLASHGCNQLDKHMESLAVRSPHPLRIGNVEYKLERPVEDIEYRVLRAPDGTLLRTVAKHGTLPRVIRTPLNEKLRKATSNNNMAIEPDPQANPTALDFFKAILFCLWGILALVAGLWSWFWEESR